MKKISRKRRYKQGDATNKKLRGILNLHSLRNEENFFTRWHSTARDIDKTGYLNGRKISMFRVA